MPHPDKKKKNCTVYKKILKKLWFWDVTIKVSIYIYIYIYQSLVYSIVQFKFTSSVLSTFDWWLRNIQKPHSELGHWYKMNKTKESVGHINNKNDVYKKQWMTALIGHSLSTLGRYFSVFGEKIKQYTISH